MSTELRPMRRAAWRNRLGDVVLDRIEALEPRERAAIRERLWRVRAYLVVLPGEELVRRALAPFPSAVRELGARARVQRFDARGGGGFYPDTNDIWLAAGVETYEGRPQVALSTRHELFHYVCWNHPLYRAEEERGFPALVGAIETSAAHAGHARYREWVRGSFLRQGDHANVIEYFADIPTNFPDAAELPPPLAAYFGPLLLEGAPGPNVGDGPERALDLVAFQRLLAAA